MAVGRSPRLPKQTLSPHGVPAPAQPVQPVTAPLGAAQPLQTPPLNPPPHHAPPPPAPRRPGRPISAWRTEVRTAERRLAEELELLPPDKRALPQAQAVEKALSRARQAVDESPSLPAWWSGDQVERGWRAVKDAQAYLVWLAADDLSVNRVANATVSSRGQKTVTTATTTAPVSNDPDQRFRDILAKQAASDEYFVSVRQLRNTLWMTTGILTLLASIALILDDTHRTFLLIGAAAGALTGILPLASAAKLAGPYGVTAVQILLKIPAGAIAALLGIYLLSGGLSTLPASTGASAYFYAVIFGLSQQAVTSIADAQAKALAKQP